jgi:hypothetical protein
MAVAEQERYGKSRLELQRILATFFSVKVMTRIHDS